MNKEPIIYISGPYSSAPEANTSKAIDIGDLLLTEGFTPIIPHLTHFWHKYRPHTWDEWLDYDERFIPMSDAILRFDGESKGADREVATARRFGKPVFHTVGALIAWRDVSRSSGIMGDESILLEAERIVNGDRGEHYGPPLEDFGRAAAIMSGILGIAVEPETVPLLQIAIKLSRQVYRQKRDNLVDIAGYAETARVCINAKTETNAG